LDGGERGVPLVLALDVVVARVTSAATPLRVLDEQTQNHTASEDGEDDQQLDDARPVVVVVSFGLPVALEFLGGIVRAVAAVVVGIKLEVRVLLVGAEGIVGI